LQAGLRSDLQRSIVPPPIPVHVREAVELMAVNRGRETGARRLAWRGASALASLAAAAAIVAIIGVSLSLRGSGPRTDRPPHARDARPVLPDPTAGQTPATSFQWTDDGLTAFASTGDAGFASRGRRVTWSRPCWCGRVDRQPRPTSISSTERTAGRFRRSGVGVCISACNEPPTAPDWKPSEIVEFAQGTGLAFSPEPISEMRFTEWRS